MSVEKSKAGGCDLSHQGEIIFFPAPVLNRRPRGAMIGSHDNG